jgi:hypothetical protein
MMGAAALRAGPSVLKSFFVQSGLEPRKVKVKSVVMLIYPEPATLVGQGATQPKIAQFSAPPARSEGIKEPILDQFLRGCSRKGDRWWELPMVSSTITE